MTGHGVSVENEQFDGSVESYNSHQGEKLNILVLAKLTAGLFPGSLAFLWPLGGAS